MVSLMPRYVATAEQLVARQMEMARLGATARELREKAGLTQLEVAEHVGVTRATINRFEAGMHDLGSSHLVALAEALRVQPSRFWR